MAATGVGTAMGAHLVGGLDAPDAESAMRTAARILGRHLHAISDGETGERNQWIGWQLDKLTALDGIELAGAKHFEGASAEYEGMPALAVDPAVTELPSGSLGYADAVEQTYPIFKRLREQGEIPGDVKFQVSLPTPYATVVAWVREPDQERFYPIYAQAMAAEGAAITDIVDADDLVIQYDVAVEIGALSGAFTAAAKLADKQFVCNALMDTTRAPAAGIERGVHFCYGDYKHRHFKVPEDLSLCVELARAVGDLADFVHMPADRDTGRDPAYYEPLRDLHPKRLALGVIDYEGDVDRTRELVEAATNGSGRMEFAVATECGMARISERGPGRPTLERLLEMHAEVAAPLR